MLTNESIAESRLGGVMKSVRRCDEGDRAGGHRRSEPRALSPPGRVQVHHPSQQPEFHVTVTCFLAGQGRRNRDMIVDCHWQ